MQVFKTEGGILNPLPPAPFHCHLELEISNVSRKGKRNGEGARVDTPASECELLPTGIPRYVTDKRGDRGGRLTVKEFAGFQTAPDGKNKAIWRCGCDCGGTVNVWTSDVGKIQSCGCQTSITHGAKCQDATPIYRKAYRAWENMIARCTNPDFNKYHRYGGRGIKVCDRWLNSFEAFYLDMGSPPSLQHSIDRMDNNQGYETANCRWATATEQANNTSTNRRVKLGGKTKTIAEWCRLFELKHKSVCHRLNRGATPTHAILCWPSDPCADEIADDRDELANLIYPDLLG
jgi:hypothetical protein